MRKVAETFAGVPDGRDTALTLRLRANMLVRHNGGTTASEPTSTTRIVYTRLSTVAQTFDQQRGLANMTRKSDSVVSVHDPIRIVPLHVDADVLAPVDAAAQPPQLTYRNGPLLTTVEVFTVYWGAAWASAPLADIASRLDGFFDFVLTSRTARPTR